MDSWSFPIIFLLESTAYLSRAWLPVSCGMPYASDLRSSSPSTLGSSGDTYPNASISPGLGMHMLFFETHPSCSWKLLSVLQLVSMVLRLLTKEACRWFEFAKSSQRYGPLPRAWAKSSGVSSQRASLLLAPAMSVATLANLVGDCRCGNGDMDGDMDGESEREEAAVEGWEGSDDVGVAAREKFKTLGVTQVGENWAVSGVWIEVMDRLDGILNCWSSRLASS